MKFEKYDKRFQDFAFDHVVMKKNSFHSLCFFVKGGHSKLAKWRKTYLKLHELAEYSKANYVRKHYNQGYHYQIRAVPAPKEILDQITFNYQRPRLPRLVE